ncbi:MAG TPA: nuclear transport factor 2 family protein [Steroidobacteraceae bacterium]|nr:nuclear transport factor 2 family protein [Steroidobacteraceae bacterium]
MLKKSARSILGLAVAGFGLWLSPVQAAEKLTAMDYIQIQQLVNRLNFALDYCGHGGNDFAALFTADGEYVIDEGDGKSRVIRGAQQLASLAGGPDCAATRIPPRAYIAHLAESLVIEPAAKGARGTSYAIYPGRKGKYFQADVAGQVGLYHDEYVRTPEGWRLKLRRHEVTPEGAAK